MNSVNIQMAFDGSQLDRVQNFIFEIDPNAKIEIKKSEYFLGESDLENLKEVVQRVENGSEKTYTQDEFDAQMTEHFKSLGK